MEITLVYHPFQILLVIIGLGLVARGLWMKYHVKKPSIVMKRAGKR